MANEIIALSGSLREGSFNTQLTRYACVVGKEIGLDMTFLDLAEYDLPLYNANDEAKSGLPEAAKALKARFAQAAGFFIATPEYNGSFPALLKNTIDWVSRPHEENEAPLIAFQKKRAVISAASPGALGGMRALVPLRLQLANVGVHVVGNQLALGKAHEAFNELGELKDPRMNALLRDLLVELHSLL
jgi:chromate reductase, NAD(P)H dehydrogenase (quinone)